MASSSDETSAGAPGESQLADQTNFIADEIRADLAAGRFSRPICTRFPPEPNGYMHIGHAKAASVGYYLAREFDGLFNLRLDDTNPAAESAEFSDAMVRDLEWLLGHDLGGRVYHASDYFPKLYDYAVKLVEKGLAYVDDLSLDEIREYRGDYHRPGKPSPWRDRPTGESLSLLEDMRAGKFAPGDRVLRAKIDMAASNMNMRDPLVYRILDQPHHRAGDWHIYPLYDFAHPLSDAIEGVTHSTCGKEFANHRPLYDWFLGALDIPEPPRQIEFAEIGLSGIVLGKRHLRRLVEGGAVSGWDDPRMPTISALRRRGYPAAAIRRFCAELGVSKSSPGTVDVSRLEFYVREHLNRTAPRVMGVLRPIKVVIDNYPEDQIEELEVPNMPGDDSFGTRMVPFSRTLYIDDSDFMVDPPKKYFRLSPGSEVRLRCAYFITCTEVVRDPTSGAITELRATYDPASRGGSSPDGRKVRGTLHWVAAHTGVPAEVRLYERLFEDSLEEWDGEESPEKYLSAESRELVSAIVEPSAAALPTGVQVQFERMGYFAVDPDSRPEAPVFSRTAKLRDTKFAKILAGK